MQVAEKVNHKGETEEEKEQRKKEKRQGRNLQTESPGYSSEGKQRRDTENSLKRTSVHLARRETTGPESALTNGSRGQEIPGLGKSAPKWQRC